MKVEPPGGDGYRHVMPVAPGFGRYFIPLNRGKRSIVVDLKTADGLETSSRLRRAADIVLHNFPRERAARFGLAWEDVHAVSPALVVGRVSSFGASGPLADSPGLRPRRTGTRGASHRTCVTRRRRARARGRDPDGGSHGGLPAHPPRPRGPMSCSATRAQATSSTSPLSRGRDGRPAPGSPLARERSICFRAADCRPRAPRLRAPPRSQAGLR